MAVELRTNVIIGGRTDSTFDTLAARIASMAAAIDSIGQPWREFSTQSLNVFKDYETYMLEAKGAMSANYSSATLLEKAYSGLQQKAQEWASTTIFHTDDVSKAISEAAHAGWDYNEMLQGIPQAMLLAQAGNIDLSSGLDYLIKTINGTGTAFEDSGALVDQWVMAANSSATTVQELGEAMTKMGATARFGDSNAELLALLGTLANAGAVGTEAGTLLRNTMIRLIAPTDKAGAAMDILGASAEEIESVLADTSITKAAKQLEGLGFSAYDSEGKLKPMIDTFQELEECLDGLNEQTQNELLSAIFPTRTITGARAILEAIGELPALYEKIVGSNGYAERVADIQTSGLMGAEERFYSKWEEFQRKIGEEQSGRMEKLYEFAGGAVDMLNGMDPVLLSTLTGMFNGIAVAGPFLGGVATAMFAIRHLGIAGTGILLAAGAVGAIVGYAEKINAMKLEDTFGTMSVNLEEIGTALAGVNQDIAEQMNSFTQYGEAAQAAATAYQEAGSTLSESLWTKMVTGAEVKEGSDEYNALMKSGDDMVAALKKGITEATKEKIKFTDYLFDTNVFDEENKASDPLYASLMSLITNGYDDAIAQAQAKGQELRKAMTSAFADGKLTEAEMENIQRVQAEMNELMAGVNGYDVEQYKMLEKSQHVSISSMKDFTKEVKEAREKSTAELEEEYLNLAAYTRARYDWSVANGASMYDPTTGEWVNAADVDINALLGQLEVLYKGKLADVGSAFDDYIIKGWMNAFNTSEAKDTFGAMTGIMDLYQTGMIGDAEMLAMFNNMPDGSDWDQIGQALESMVELYGGAEKMAGYIDQYRTAGGAENLARADWFEQMLLLYGLTGHGGVPDLSGYNKPEERRGVEQMRDAMENLWAGGELTDAMFAAIEQTYNSLTKGQREAWDQQVAQYAKDYDLGFVADEMGGNALKDSYANWLGAYLIANDKVYDKGRYERNANVEATQQQAEEKVAGYAEQPAQAKLDVDTSQVETAAAMLQEAADAPYEATVTVNFDDNGGYQPQDGSMTVYVNYVDKGGPSGSGKASTGSGTVRGATGNLSSYLKYAEGGRATEASIFGEVPGLAEWAIPEEHTERTAALLNAAREASGFSWNELISRFGGLGARTDGVVVNIGSYAPVIHASDASGVERKLMEDKERLREIVQNAVRDAMERNALHDAIEVYA